MPGADRQTRLDGFALELLEAERDPHRIVRLSDRLEDLTEAEAYAIAAQNIRKRPGPTVGYKLGYTSAAMRRQMNIAHPNFGVLTRERIVGPGERLLRLEGLVHPRVEPELTIRLGRDLQGGGDTALRVADAVDCIYPSIEVVDTRYEDYVFKAVDNIADNSSAARCVLGTPVALGAAPLLRTCAVELLIEDQALAAGVGADAMGDPLAAVAWLADTLAESGRHLKAGELVMTGGLTRAFEVRAGQRVCARFSGFEPLLIECA